MRLAIVVPLLALTAAGCSWRPIYEKPQLQGRIEDALKVRDDCLLANTPQFDDGRSEVKKVARSVAMSCTTQTTKLMELAIPQPDDKARTAFQQEAERRAADIVLTFRRVDSTVEDRRPRASGAPTKL